MTAQRGQGAFARRLIPLLVERGVAAPGQQILDIGVAQMRLQGFQCGDQLGRQPVQHRAHVARQVRRLPERRQLLLAPAGMQLGLY